MALGLKVVGDWGVDGSKFLQRLHLPKAQHRALSQPERQLNVLGPIVDMAANVAAVLIAKLAHPCVHLCIFFVTVRIIVTKSALSQGFGRR